MQLNGRMLDQYVQGPLLAWSLVAGKNQKKKERNKQIEQKLI